MKGCELSKNIKKESERTKCISLLAKTLNCTYRDAEKHFIKMEKQYINPDKIQDNLELKEKIRKVIMDKAEEIYRNKNCSINTAIEKAKQLILESLEGTLYGNTDNSANFL